MIKKILTPLVFALSVGSFSAYAQFGGAPGGRDGNGGNGGGFNPEDPVSLEGLIARCVQDPTDAVKQSCLQHGFEYETLETIVNISSNEEMRMTSEHVNFEGRRIRERHYDIFVECVDCQTGNVQSRLNALGDRIFSGLVVAHNDVNFKTKKKKRNGRNTPNQPTTRNDGRSVSDRLSDINEGLGTANEGLDFVDRLMDLFSSNDETNPVDDIQVEFMIATDLDGNPTQIIRVDADGNLITIADLTRATLDTDSQGRPTISFSGTMSPHDAGRFFDIVNDSLSAQLQSFGIGGRSVTCRIAYTGENGKLVAQVVCF